MFHKRTYAVAYVVFMLFGLVCTTSAATLPQARAPMPTDPSPPKKSSSWKKLVGKLTSGQLETIPEKPKQTEFKMVHDDWSFGGDNTGVKQ
ncbi:hypothetical protein F5050DRAFT_209779 [Lentinula boryana]|uniref:Uncharacterized protein n=1 Tax=Lentinula boryana TaxID=40481 RepID=A0ABQ8QBN3_9AGAR|nr:hypothetical protein F5050DRAFT_209779 [Lentinula boryana]